MPDLGKYAVEVQSAYLVTFVILGALVAVVWLRARRARAELEAAEKRAGSRG